MSRINRAESGFLHWIDLSETKLAERLPADKRRIEFRRGVNLLVGPNGSGKSTVLSTLKADGQPKGMKFESGGVKTFFFDFEKDNPRSPKGYLEQAPGRLQLQLLGKFRSHGEMVRVIHELMTKKDAKDSLLILDEPEQALDLDGLEDLAKLLASSEAAQIIVATHSPVLILDPKFNVIEMVPGYKQKMADFFRNLATQCK